MKLIFFIEIVSPKLQDKQTIQYIFVNMDQLTSNGANINDDMLNVLSDICHFVSLLILTRIT